MRLLLVEDNADLAANIREHLETRGHALDAAGDGPTGLRLALAHDYDAVILDLGLPGMNGLEVCRRLRHEARRPIPVLMLTARDTLGDKLGGFTAGADDYLVKPFALQELEARLGALARRGRDAAAELRVADLTVNPDTLQVRRAGEVLALTPSGIRLLVLLMRAAPRVLPHAEIERALWADGPPESGVLRTHMHALRVAVDRRFAVKLLHTVHGVGYQIRAPDVA